MEKGPSTYAEYWTSPYAEVDHFDRHGFLLGYDSITEYTKGAIKLSKNTSNNIRKFKAPNGSIYIFLIEKLMSLSLFQDLARL